MPQIDIEIDRPWLTLALIVGAVVVMIHVSSGTQAAPVGGDVRESQSPAVAVAQAEQDIGREREMQSVLERREQILRADLDIADDPIVRDELTQLLLDQRAAEERIRASLHQIWNAQAVAGNVSRDVHDHQRVQFVWPVEPLLGISARFNDPSYEKKFGMPHHAIDLPAKQGTIVAAAADGVVVNVSDQGMGFNSLVIRHAGGYSTLYGHVETFLVSEGQRVRAGDPVALSGGTPGTPGAGLMTTGPHLHFALYKDGEAADPLLFLPNE